MKSISFSRIAQVLSLMLIASFSTLSVAAQFVHGSVSERSWSGQYLFLKQVQGSKAFLIDSTMINEDLYFAFPKRSYEMGFYTLSKAPKNKVDIIINPTEEDVLLHFEDKYLASSMIVRGSDENFLLSNFKAVKDQTDRLVGQYEKKWDSATSEQRTSYQTKVDSIIAARDKFLVAAQKNHPNSFFNLYVKSLQEAQYFPATASSETEAQFKRNHYFDFTDFSDERLINSRVFTDRIRDFLKDEDCTPKTEQGFMSSLDYIMGEVSTGANDQVREFCLNYLLGQFNNYGPMFLFEYMVENYLLEESCSDLSVDEIYQRKAEQYKNLRPGNIAPNFVIADANGQFVDIAAAAAKSKGTVLFFWSSHCHFCKEQLPEFFKLFNQYWDKGLTVIAVSLDEQKAPWMQAVNSYNMTWTNVCDFNAWKSQAAQLYKIHKTPVYYLLSPEMEILAKPKVVSELKPAVDKLFEN